MPLLIKGIRGLKGIVTVELSKDNSRILDFRLHRLLGSRSLGCEL